MRKAAVRRPPERNTRGTTHLSRQKEETSILTTNLAKQDLNSPDKSMLIANLINDYAQKNAETSSTIVCHILSQTAMLDAQETRDQAKQSSYASLVLTIWH